MLCSALSAARAVPPIRAKIVREWSYFLSGKSYSVSCQVMGSHPTAYTNAWVGEAGGSGRANTRELPVQNFEVRTYVVQCTVDLYLDWEPATF